MVYPTHSILTHSVRRAMMVTLIILFFLISPTVLLYTAGYRYDWQHKQLKQTGVISVDVFPTDATVTINQSTFTEKLPLELRNRAPGRYQVKIERTGYQSWEKDIVVESKKTTYIKDIQLFLTALPVPLLNTATTPTAAIASTDGSYIILMTSQPPVYDFSLYTARHNKNVPLLRTSSDTSPRILWAPGRPWVLIDVSENQEHTLHLIRADAPEQIFTHRLPITNHSFPVQWREGGGAQFFVGQEQELLLITPQSMTAFAALSTSSPWFVDDENTVWVIDRDEHYIQTTHTIDPEIIPLPPEYRVTNIVSVNKTRLLVQAENALLILKRDNVRGGRPQVLQTASTTWNHLTKKWLAWSPWELWEIDDTGKATLLQRTSQQLIKVLPLDRHGVLLLTFRNALTAFNAGYLVTHTLFQGEDLEAVGVYDRQRTIYFLGKVGTKTNLFELPY